jgi:hypothetical protein
MTSKMIEAKPLADALDLGEGRAALFLNELYEWSLEGAYTAGPVAEGLNAVRVILLLLKQIGHLFE